MSSPSSPPIDPPPIPDDPTPENADLPLPLSASIVLTSLPQDATSALEKASKEDNDGVPEKGMCFQTPPKVLLKSPSNFLFPGKSLCYHLFSSFEKNTLLINTPPQNSNNPLPTRRLRPPAQTTHFQSQQREPLRDRRCFLNQAVGGQWGRGSCGR